MGLPRNCSTAMTTDEKTPAKLYHSDIQDWSYADLLQAGQWHASEYLTCNWRPASFSAAVELHGGTCWLRIDARQKNASSFLPNSNCLCGLARKTSTLVEAMRSAHNLTQINTRSTGRRPKHEENKNSETWQSCQTTRTSEICSCSTEQIDLEGTIAITWRAQRPHEFRREMQKQITE